MVFSAVSMVSSFEVGEDTDDLVSVGEKTDRYTHTQLYASLPHIDLVISRTKGDHSCFIQTEMQQSMAILQSALILWDLSIWGGDGRGSLLALASGPRVQSISSKSHKALFQPVLGTSDLFSTCGCLCAVILSYATLWLRLGHHRNTDTHRETDLQNQQTSWGKDSAQQTFCLRYCSSCAMQ